jgi:hypothetical protein
VLNFNNTSRIRGFLGDAGVTSSGGDEINFNYQLFSDGYVSSAAQEEIFGQAYGNLYGWYNVGHSVIVLCDLTQGNLPTTAELKFIGRSVVDIRVSDPVNPGIAYFLRSVDRHTSQDFFGKVQLNANTECKTDSNLLCNNFNPAGEGPRLHLSEDVEFVFSDSGLSVNGTLYEWQDRPLGIFEGAVIDNGSVTDLWKVPGDFPFEATVTLKRRDSCQPGICDCEVDLTGRTVVFKGKTFTYGSGDEFTSDDGSEFWEESPTGVFRKVTYDACDVSQQFIALEETAEIVCSESIEEGPFWAVLFTVVCRERDACGGAFDRSRATLFNGIFTCGSGGFPTGTPTVELANDSLSDPAPTGDCASFPAAPSINFT